MKSTLKISAVCATLAVVIAGVYVSSVVWRVSAAEQKLFGRSYLLPLKRRAPEYNEYPTRESHDDGTYSFVRAGKFVKVHKQMILGFQHTYSSALTAYEVGDMAADALLRANEYAETYLSAHGDSLRHYMNSRRDLYNNRVGRAIGADARNRGLSGQRAELYIVRQILQAMDNGIVLSHYRDEKVRLLPTPEQYGCPGLPKPTELAGLNSHAI